MIEINNQVLDLITGEYGILEVIDSASIFELPKESLLKIKEVIKKKHIHTLFIAVSYTHLDVYKRQHFYNCSNRFRNKQLYSH